MDLPPLISIVIPVYNAEEHLEECLNSISNQSFREWECILVNDSSTDNSFSIIKKYADQDPRFVYYTVSPNSGSAKVPLDTGISKAKSEWVVIIGNDDYIETDTLEKLYNRAIETHASIICLKMLPFNNTKEAGKVSYSSIPSDDFDMNRILPGKEAVMLTIPEWIIGFNGALVKRSLYDLRTNIGHGTNHMNADEYDTRELLINSDSVAFVDTIYHYRKHPNSITTKLSVKLFDSLITDRMLETLLTKYFGTNSYEARKVREKRMNGIIEKQNLLLKHSKYFPKSDFKTIRKMIKNNYIDIEKKDLFCNNRIKKTACTNGFILFEIVSYARFIARRIYSFLMK